MVLPGPPLTAPVAVELVSVPTGKLDRPTRPDGMLVKVALAPSNPPMVLAPAPMTAPEAETVSTLPKLMPPNPPIRLPLPLALTATFANVGLIEPTLVAIQPTLVPKNPPTAL